ncbi:LLM class flavin-dependent oxidoreductase [Nocardia terpenica]|uniref:LLM class flavin-dependent oxidoreductase n=2 Tax=Nocardia terpenica TaxID=455432 RepID=A0A291RD94_9NOCA|nr:LLM class flavin-dependent oxidoreductase [Nocardia terpenica]
MEDSMRIGLGLPIADPADLPEWARRAEAGPFSTLGLLDRLVYDNPEPLMALSLLAGVTTRIRLQTEVLIAPLRDPVLLAKQVATLDRMSGGRLVLGLGVGGRPDDHEASGTDIRTRGRRLDQQLALMRRLWTGDRYSNDCGPIGPTPTHPDGPELLFGGFQPAALDRIGRWGGGLLCAAAPTWAENLIETARHSWRTHNRPGKPRIVAQMNTALGPRSIDKAHTAIATYYKFSGHANHMTNGMLTTPHQIQTAITQFEALGADELMLYCWDRDPDQVNRIADIIG